MIIRRLCSSLRRFLAVILATSKAEADIVKTYNLHANCYITKPVDLTQFMGIIGSIEDSGSAS